MNKNRLKKIAREKEMILAENNPGVLFLFLRKSLDMLNRPAIIQKALEFEEEILPLVVEKLIRNNHDVFVENAVQLLSNSKNNYSTLLLERYAEFRSPYAQSLLCLIIGFRGTEDIIPWMINKFSEMRSLYPEETYEQGPLLALYELNNRFYLN